MSPKPSLSTCWLTENGPRELELLFRAIVYHPSSPVLIADNEGNYQEASVGAGKLLGVPREKVIGSKIDDFVPPSLKPNVSQLWQAFLKQGDQKGVLPLLAPDGTVHEVEFIAKDNVLPSRHVVVLHDKTQHRRLLHRISDRHKFPRLIVRGNVEVHIDG